ncbi:MAG: ATP-binding protein [Clostridia bacterium]|nr:ATP-binding protein [Clostridia bacterium]
MAYKRSVYMEAKNRLSARRRQAEQDQMTRHSLTVAKCPEILTIESEMASYGASVIKAVGMGGDAKEYVKSLSIKSIAAQDKRKALLKQNGYPEDYLDVRYSCPVCKDTGFHDEHYCQCHLQLIKEIAREEINRQAPLDKCSFDSFKLRYYPDIVDKALGVNQKEHMQSVFELCRSYADNFTLKNKSIFMTGLTGLGKTHLSLAIAGRVIDKGYNVHYESAQNLMDKLEKEHFSRSTSDSSFKDEILECDLLIIDDLGCEFQTQFTKAEIYNIINTRHLRSLPTIINSNLSVKELEDVYHPRVASRIMGNYLLMLFCGKDNRQN